MKHRFFLKSFASKLCRLCGMGLPLRKDLAVCHRELFFKQSLAIGIAVAISVLIQFYFSFSQEAWMVFSTFLVSQTTRGAPLRQSLVFFVLMLIAMMSATILIANIKESSIVNTVICMIFLFASEIIFLNQPSITINSWWKIFFPLSLLGALFFVKPNHLMSDRVIDISIGAIIAILCVQFIFRTHFEKKFRQEIVPMLQTLDEYSRALIENFSYEKGSHLLEQKKQQIKNIITSQSKDYPEWVYEVGFNPGLRAGFRFFLINLETIIELFFSLHYLSQQQIENTIKQELTQVIVIALEKNRELLQVLHHFFTQNQLADSISDYTSDIKELEIKLHSNVPNDLELLDISPDYIFLTALVRDIKDMRQLLLQLVMAIPTIK